MTALANILSIAGSDPSGGAGGPKATSKPFRRSAAMAWRS